MHLPLCNPQKGAIDYESQVVQLVNAVKKEGLGH